MKFPSPVLVVKITDPNKAHLVHKTGMAMRTSEGIRIHIGTDILLDSECFWAPLKCTKLLVNGQVVSPKEVAKLFKNGIIPHLCLGDLTQITIEDKAVTATCAKCGVDFCLNLSEV